MITLFKFGSCLSSWIPQLILAVIAHAAGTIVFWLMPRVRRNTIANMAVVLDLEESHPKVRALARRSVVEFATHIIDFLHGFRQTHQALADRTISIEGYENFKALHEMRRGGIMISAHFGNWEWCGGLVSLDHRTNVVAETMRSRSFTAMLGHVRGKLNLHSIQLGNAARDQVGNAAREMLRALRRGEYVALLADRPTPGEGVRVEFFGQPAWVPEGAAALAHRADSPLMVGGVTRNPDGTYTAHAMPPIVWDRDEPRDQAVQRAMQQVMCDLETLIRKAPEQWYMFRPMWEGV